MRRRRRSASRSCSRWSAAIRHCSSPPHRRPATSSSLRSRGCRRSAWCMRRRSWLEAAHGCAASVMLVPQVLARRQGRWRRWSAPNRIPLCAIAARIAAAAGECLLLLVWGTAELAKAAAEQARSAGLASRRIATRSIARRDAGGCPARAGHEQRTPGRAGARCMRRRRCRGIRAHCGVTRRSRAGRRDRPLNLNSGVRVASSAAARPPDRGRVRAGPCSTGRNPPVAAGSARSRHRGTTARAVNP